MRHNTWIRVAKHKMISLYRELGFNCNDKTLSLLKLQRFFLAEETKRAAVQIKLNGAKISASVTLTISSLVEEILIVNFWKFVMTIMIALPTVC